MSNDTTIIKGSGNVFANLGLPQPKERLFKAQLAAQIQIAMQHQGLTQDQVAERTGFSETEFAELLRGRLADITLYQLFRCLNRLGHRIEVRLSPEETDPANARTLLIAA